MLNETEKEQNATKSDDNSNNNPIGSNEQNNNKPEGATYIITPGAEETESIQTCQNLCAEYRVSEQMLDKLCESSYLRAKRDGELDKFQMKQSTEDPDDAFRKTTCPIPIQQSTKWMGLHSDTEDRFGKDKSTDGNTKKRGRRRQIPPSVRDLGRRLGDSHEKL